MSGVHTGLVIFSLKFKYSVANVVSSVSWHCIQHTQRNSSSLLFCTKGREIHAVSRQNINLNCKSEPFTRVRCGSFSISIKYYQYLLYAAANMGRKQDMTKLALPLFLLKKWLRVTPRGEKGHALANPSGRTSSRDTNSQVRVQHTWTLERRECKTLQQKLAFPIYHIRMCMDVSQWRSKLPHIYQHSTAVGTGHLIDTRFVVQV